MAEEMIPRPVLTGKQLDFCRKVVELGQVMDAYKAVYACQEVTAATIHKRARALMDNPLITEEIERLRAENAKAQGITVDTLAGQLEKTWEVAMTAKQCGAAVSAVMGIAKLFGLDKQKVEVSGSDGETVRIEFVTAITRNPDDPPHEPD